MRITLYKGCAITPDKNMMVDEIEKYLVNLTRYEVPEPNYVKNDLNILLTLNVSQAYLEAAKFNYCRIITDENTTYYYFITNATWKSSSAVQFSLNIDSINTFRKDFEGQWNKKTNILRQHEDRLTKVSNGVYDRVINQVSEGIQGIQELTNDETIQESKTLIKWYLVYIAKTDIPADGTSVPIECRLMPNIQMTFNKPSDVKSLASIDRADPKLIRIIACPYSPVEVDYTGITINSMPYGFSFINGFIVLDTDTIAPDFVNVLHAKDYTSDLRLNIPYALNDKQLRNSLFESKLYHSDFRTERYQYDNTYRDLALERITDSTMPINISFYQSTNFNSNSLFRFETNDTYKLNEIYENYLICKRNNELPILNSSYLNYMRNGYNYDKKNLDIAQAKAGLGLVGSLVTLGAGIVGAAATGGTSLLVAIGAIAGGATGLFSAAASMTQNATAFEQKQEQIKNSAAGITSSDDFSLLKVYNGNKLHHYTKTLRPRDAKIVEDLFYYCGYKKEQRDIPNYNSRIWFNFIQCQPEFNEANIDKVAMPYLADIKARFAAGVTVYHNRNNVYDFGQEKENWEKSLVA